MQNRHLKIDKSIRRLAKSSKDAAKTGLKPLGLGSTGRTTAANITEELAMKEIMSNPLWEIF